MGGAENLGIKKSLPLNPERLGMKGGRAPGCSGDYLQEPLDSCSGSSLLLVRGRESKTKDPCTAYLILSQPSTAVESTSCRVLIPA